MQFALPHPSQSIAIPLIALTLGAAGGATVTAIVADDDVIRLPAVSQPTVSQSDSFTARPQEGVAAQAISPTTQAPGLSERASDHPPQTSDFVSRPQEGVAARNIGSGQAPGLSEKSSDPSLQPNTQNSFGTRP